LDNIKATNGILTQSVGGPPCYSGITSRRFGFEVELVTKVGQDFPKDSRNFLLQNKIMIKDSQQLPDKLTTGFDILAEEDTRKLILRSKCAPLTAEEIDDIKVDFWLASPVIDEIPPYVLAKIKHNGGSKKFVMLDPQGYMRVVDEKGAVTLKERLELDLSGIRAIKVDQEEMMALTSGLKGIDGMLRLQSLGIEFILSTFHREIHLLHERTHYWVKLRHIDTPDSTGAGDILSAAFSCAYIKERDPLWAFCFGAGALRAALETREAGPAKVPSMSKIEQSASYFYNTVGFQQLS